MKAYETPTIDLVELDESDILTASFGDLFDFDDVDTSNQGIGGGSWWGW